MNIEYRIVDIDKITKISRIRKIQKIVDKWRIA